MDQKVTLNAYLFFDGNCKEAMDFYCGIFGGNVVTNNYDDMPGDHGDLSGKVMHAALTGGDVELMASDAPFSEHLGTGKINLSLSGNNEEKLRTFYDSLAVGGNAQYPLKKESWGDVFGSLTDKYGVTWMVNISGAKE